MKKRLQDKVAIITGAGCVGPGWGNGRSMAYRFMEEGASILAVDKSQDTLTETLEVCAPFGKKIKTTQFGDQRYGQYQDKTPLKLYKKKDTLDKERRRLYRLRHNYRKPLHSPGWFSLKYLW